MISIQPTQHLTGVTVSGDEEGEYPTYDAVRIRVLGVFIDIRHAIIGNRGAKHVPNGLDRDGMRDLSITGSEMNIYLTFEVLSPEMMFVSYALNDFIHLFERNNKTHAWNSNGMVVRKSI